MSRLNLHVPAGMPDHEYPDSDFDEFFTPSPRSILCCRMVAVTVFPTSSFYFISSFLISVNKFTLIDNWLCLLHIKKVLNVLAR